MKFKKSKTILLAITFALVVTSAHVVNAKDSKTISDYYYEMPDEILLKNKDEAYEPQDKSKREEMISLVDNENYYLELRPRWLDGKATITAFIKPDGQLLFVQEFRGCGPMCHQEVFFHELVGNEWQEKENPLPDTTEEFQKLPHFDLAISHLKNLWGKEDNIWAGSSEEFTYSLIYELPRFGTKIELLDQYSREVIYEFKWSNGEFIHELSGNISVPDERELKEPIEESPAPEKTVESRPVTEKSTPKEPKDSKPSKQLKEGYKTIAKIVDTIALLIFIFYIPLKTISSHAKLSKYGKGFMVATIIWVLLSRLGIGWDYSALAVAVNALIRPVDLLLMFLSEKTFGNFILSGTFLLLSDIIFIYGNRLLLRKLPARKLLLLNISIMLLTWITMAVIYLDDFLFGMSGF